MKIPTRRAGAVGLGLALVVGAGGIAYAAADPGDWYTGGNATEADPDNVATLKIVKADGSAVTGGSTSDLLGAFAVAGGTVRQDDKSASLFVHLAASDTAPAAWSGTQASGTTVFSGSGAAAGPTGSSGKPFVALADSLPLEQAVDVFPSTEAASSYQGVYELRLRTSSATAGVSDQYASEYVKITGGQWVVTDGPTLGETSAGPATIAPSWGANFAYGAAHSVGVVVKGGDTGAKGSVVLKSGSAVISAPQNLSAAGAATLVIPKDKLLPGSRPVTVAFTTSDATIAASTVSTAKTFAIAKAKAAASVKITKKPTAKKKGKATVTVTTPAGLAKATGKATITFKKGSRTVKVKATISGGKASVSVPKLKAGSYKVTVTYAGDARYLAATSKAVSLKVKKK